jgi:CRP-like cAMP-binding protein
VSVAREGNRAVLNGTEEEILGEAVRRLMQTCSLNSLEHPQIAPAGGEAAQWRLADLLVELTGSYGIRDARGTLLRIKLSQSALGSLLGVSREIVNHAVSDLRRRGIIDVVDGRVIVRDRERSSWPAPEPSAKTLS